MAAIAPVQPAAKPRKKLGKRAAPDRSQGLRRVFQLAFLLLNIWIGVQFYLFVRYYETGGLTVQAGRPAGVEGWLPIAAMMNLKVLLLTGHLPNLHPAGMFLLIAFLAMSWLSARVSAAGYARWGPSRSICGAWGAGSSAAVSACPAAWISACAASNTFCSACSFTP